MRVTYNLDAFRQWAKIVGALNDEAVIDFGKAGIRSHMVDPAHVAYADAMLNPVAVQELEQHDTDKDGNRNAVIDMQEVLPALRWAVRRKAKVITLEVMGEPKAQRAALYYTKTVKRRLTGYETEGYNASNPPEIWRPDGGKPMPEKYAAITVKTPDLISAFKEIDEVADHIIIEVDEKGMRLGSHPEGMPSVSLDIPRDYLDEHVCKESVKSMFPSDYIVNMVAACAAPLIKMWVTTDYPVQFEWDIQGSLGHVYAALAPRIESE